jgi:hypothetical protein
MEVQQELFSEFLPKILSSDSITIGNESPPPLSRAPARRRARSRPAPEILEDFSDLRTLAGSRDGCVYAHETSDFPFDYPSIVSEQVSEEDLFT